MLRLNTIKHFLSCGISVSDTTKPLNFNISLDSDCIASLTTHEPLYSVTHSFYEDTLHNLSFHMSGKTNEHTILDDDNNIVSSTQIEILNIEIDGVSIMDALLSDDNVSTYLHSFNGNSPEKKHNGFDSSMGFNGLLNIEFTTPIHKWISERMS